jgi:LacI family transcriptional regulator
VTLKDIAAACGVSRATVSLVLQDSSRVSAATKERVRETMRQLGYVYDRRAANLRARRSMTVALVATDVRNPFFAELTMAIERALYKQGYTLLLGYSYDDLERQAKLLEAMVEHRVDGLLLVPSYQTTSGLLARTLVASGTPHVLVARHVRRHNADYVGVDNVRAAELVGEHLASRGHRRVAFLGGPPRSTARIERERGLRTALKRAGVEFDPNLSIATSNDRDGGVRAVEQLLAAGPVPDAVVSYSDVAAVGVMAALRAAGIQPGREVAIASFDDIPDAVAQQPPLTSVATYPDRTGAEAAELLLRRIDDPSLPPRTVLLAPELQVRESTMNSHLTAEHSRRRDIAQGGALP